MERRLVGVHVCCPWRSATSQRIAVSKKGASHDPKSRVACFRPQDGAVGRRRSRLWVLCVPFHAVAQNVFNGPGRYQFTSLGSGSTKGGIPVWGLWKRPWRKVLDLGRNNQTSPIPFHSLGADHQVWDTRSATFGFYHVQNVTNGTALAAAKRSSSSPPSRRRNPARQTFSVAEWETVQHWRLRHTRIPRQTFARSSDPACVIVFHLNGTARVESFLRASRS